MEEHLLGLSARRLLNHIPPETPIFSPRNVVFAVLYCLIAYSIFGCAYGIYKFCQLMLTPVNRIQPRTKSEVSIKLENIIDNELDSEAGLESDRNLLPLPPAKQQRRPNGIKILTLDGVVLGKHAQISPRSSPR